MSYSITEGIADAKCAMAERKKIAALYPDATLSDGRWEVRELREVNTVAYLDGGGRQVIALGHEIESGIVVFGRHRQEHAGVALRALLSEPTLGPAILAWLAARC